MNLLSKDFLSFIIGVDEANIENGKIIIKFFKNSKRYSCMTEAMEYLDEYKSCKSYEKDFLIDGIKRLYDFLNGVIERANTELPFGMEYKYDDENQRIIDEMKDILIQKGKL